MKLNARQYDLIERALMRNGWETDMMDPTTACICKRMPTGDCVLFETSWRNVAREAARLLADRKYRRRGIGDYWNGVYDMLWEWELTHWNDPDPDRLAELLRGEYDELLNLVRILRHPELA